MALKLNWDRVKQLHAELTSDGWKETDKLTFILIEKDGKPKKAIVQFAELYRFFWHLADNDSLNVATFMVQDKDGKILYRHRKIVGNEEIPNGGHTDIVSHWSALTEDERNTYITLIVAQINSHER